MRSDLIIALAALSVGLSGTTLLSHAQEAGADLAELVRNAEARAETAKAEILGIETAPIQRSQQYQREATELAQGNRDRLRKGLTYLGKGYNVDFFDMENAVEEGVVYVAISLSMPRESLRQLAADAQKAGAVLVLRGFVDGSFKKTRQLMLSIFTEGEEAGVIIDPRVFQQYQIDRVPSFVAATAPVESCEDGGLECVRPTVPFDVVRGNIPLATALQILAEKGDAAPFAARRSLQRLEAGL